jgi:hypothetical protein
MSWPGVSSCRWRAAGFPACLMLCLSPGQVGYQLDGAVDFVFGVVVVRGQPDQGVDAAVLHVEGVVLGHCGEDVDPGAAQSRSCLLCCQHVDDGSDDRGAVLAEVVDGDAGQLVAEPGAERRARWPITSRPRPRACRTATPRPRTLT